VYNTSLFTSEIIGVLNVFEKWVVYLSCLSTPNLSLDIFYISETERGEENGQHEHEQEHEPANWQKKSTN
jgi:hypothetical protein